MRSKNALVTGSTVVVLMLAALFLGACASGSSGGGESSAAAAEPAKAAPPKGVAPPAGSPMAKVQMNMSPQQVTEILGAPTGQKNYPSGKAFNPFNYGNDSGQRMEYDYTGVGRVVFALPKWGGVPKVVRVDYDPAQN